MFSVAGLDISFHRLGREGWSFGVVLRSWGDAPWRPVGVGVAVACLPGEVIWLGLTNKGSPATVTCTSSEGHAARLLLVPPDWQLGWLLDGEGRAEPVALSNSPSVTYRLNLRRADQKVSESLDLLLLSPAAWATHFEALDLKPVEVPPPVLRYSRIVRPRRRPSSGTS